MRTRRDITNRDGDQPFTGFSSCIFSKQADEPPTPDELGKYFFDEKATAPVRSVLVKEIYNQGAFKNGNTIELQVKDLPRGNYYLHVMPGKDSDQKTDKIRIVLE